MVNRGITDAKKEIINNVLILLTDGKYYDAIKKGLLIYNNNYYYKKLADKEKVEMLYNVALSYKKINMFEQSLQFIDKSIALSEKYEYEDLYIRNTWLKNESMKRLGIDDGKIRDRYEECRAYYENVDE
jgi:tetratricopeptide (TPR) repeat protein